MLSRLLLIACAGAAFAADPGQTPAPAGAAPWTANFTTTVRGKDRQFVSFGGKTYILVSPDELAGGIGDGQDVALTAKLHRLSSDSFGLFLVDGLVLSGGGDALAGRLDGDNIHLLGSLTANGTKRTLAIHAVAAATSDAGLLAARQAGIGDDDWDRRLGVVSWCRDQIRLSGSDAWAATADALLARMLLDMSAKAGENRDVSLALRAIDLAINQAKDPVLAARVASAPWIREHGGPQAEVIARRMRGLGFALYQEAWLPRAQAQEREFEDRFLAIPWRDAEAFYRLGRWADENAETLPLARERSWRCYRAGSRADPSHPGIARELGIKPTAGDASVSPADQVGAAASDLFDKATGLRVPAPTGWRKGPSQGTDTVWAAADSDTAFLTIRVLPPPIDREVVWNLVCADVRTRNGFTELATAESQRGPAQVRLLSSTWIDGDQTRFVAVGLAIISADRPAVHLEARGLTTDRENLEKALLATAGSISLTADQAQPQPTLENGAPQDPQSPVPAPIETPPQP